MSDGSYVVGVDTWTEPGPEPGSPHRISWRFHLCPAVGDATSVMPIQTDDPAEAARFRAAYDERRVLIDEP